MPYRLKQEIIKEIQQGGTIYGLIADELEIAPVSLPVILNRNHRRLTEYGNLKLISKYLKKPIDTLVEQVSKIEAASATA